MTSPSPAVQGLLRVVLEQEGKVPLERVVQELLPVGTLRDLARKHGLSPKGYRIEKAPAPRLAKLLIDVRNPTLVTEVLELLLELRGTGNAQDAGELADDTPTEETMDSQENEPSVDEEVPSDR